MNLVFDSFADVVPLPPTVELEFPPLAPAEDDVEVGDDPTTFVVVDLCFFIAAADVVVVVLVVRVWANCTCSASDEAEETSSFGGGCTDKEYGVPRYDSISSVGNVFMDVDVVEATSSSSLEGRRFISKDDEAASLTNDDDVDVSSYTRLLGLSRS